MKPPSRMLEDAQLPDELRADLTNVAQTHVRYDVESGLAGLQSTLAAMPPVDAAGGGSGAGLGASSASSTVAGLPLAIKAVLVAALGGAVALGANQLGAPAKPVPQPAAQTSAPAALPAVPPAAKASEVPSDGAATPASVAVESAAVGGAPSGTSAGEPARRAQASQSPSRREIARTLRIKALLEHDPAAAHRLIVASSREFPAGVLAEERAGLDVIALWKLGEERALERAERFVARYPHSPLRARLERILAGEAP